MITEGDLYYWVMYMGEDRAYHLSSIEGDRVVNALRQERRYVEFTDLEGSMVLVHTENIVDIHYSTPETRTRGRELKEAIESEGPYMDKF